jgi:hypothetical protein
MTTKRFTVGQVIARARQLHIILGVDGETLNIIAPRGALTEKIRAVLREYKSELVAYLKEQERLYLQQHQEPPLCATCLDLDRDHPVEALPEPHTDDFYYCERHHPALQCEERGGHA